MFCFLINRFVYKMSKSIGKYASQVPRAHGDVTSRLNDFFVCKTPPNIKLRKAANRHIKRNVFVVPSYNYRNVNSFVLLTNQLMDLFQHQNCLQGQSQSKYPKNVDTLCYQQRQAQHTALRKMRFVLSIKSFKLTGGWQKILSKERITITVSPFFFFFF